MRNVFVVSLAALFLNANCQEFTKRFQSQTWYAKGDLYRGETTVVKSDKPVNYSSDFKFLTNGELEMFIKAADDTKFVCLYEFKKDMMKLFYPVTYKGCDKKSDVALYFKVKELSNSKDFEFTPIAESEFK